MEPLPNPLPQNDDAKTAARGISEILAKANRADLPAMRTSLSFLTSAGGRNWPLPCRGAIRNTMRRWLPCRCCHPNGCRPLARARPCRI